ncbi:hypothetical protein [Sphingobacterium shayense]|nr:hypothetical protein [Sphingobacterium shayense]
MSTKKESLVSSKVLYDGALSASTAKLSFPLKKEEVAINGK